MTLPIQLATSPMDTGAPDERLAPADRELVLVDLGEPPDLSRISRGRYALLLEPRSEPVE